MNNGIPGVTYSFSQTNEERTITSGALKLRWRDTAKANTTVGFLGHLDLLVKSRLIPFLSLTSRLITHLRFRANEKTNYKP